MKVTVNKAAVKAMLFLTVPAASVLGFAHLLVPEMLWTFLGAKQHYVPQHYLYGDAFMGSTFLAFATAALIGLASDEPAAFWPILIVQMMYKLYWVAALLASRASLSMANSFFLCGWLAFIAGDVYAFASGHRHEVVHKKST